MRIMSVHRTQPRWEAGELPSHELVKQMGELLGEMGKAGVLLDAGGLRPSSLGVRLNFRGGKRTVTPGPFTPGNELPAGFAALNVTSLDEAVAWATELAGVVGDVEVDIRPFTESWDLGFGPKPAGLSTTRYMAVHKATPDSEAGVPLTAQQREKMAALLGRMRAAGVLLAAEGFQPSSAGKRLSFVGGNRTVVDGPFAESKELIAGYVLFDVPSLTEAVEWATRFAGVVGDVELDLRPLVD